MLTPEAGELGPMSKEEKVMLFAFAFTFGLIGYVIGKTLEAIL